MRTRGAGRRRRGRDASARPGREPLRASGGGRPGRRGRAGSRGRRRGNASRVLQAARGRCTGPSIRRCREGLAAGRRLRRGRPSSWRRPGSAATAAARPWIARTRAPGMPIASRSAVASWLGVGKERDDAVAGRGGQPIAARARRSVRRSCERRPPRSAARRSPGSPAQTDPTPRARGARARRDQRCQQRVPGKVLPDRADVGIEVEPATEPCLDSGERSVALDDDPDVELRRTRGHHLDGPDGPRRSRLSVGRGRDRRSRRRGSPAPRRTGPTPPVERRRRPETDRRARQGRRLSCRQSPSTSRSVATTAVHTTASGATDLQMTQDQAFAPSGPSPVDRGTPPGRRPSLGRSGDSPRAAHQIGTAPQRPEDDRGAQESSTWSG